MQHRAEMAPIPGILFLAGGGIIREWGSAVRVAAGSARCEGDGHTEALQALLCVYSEPPRPEYKLETFALSLEVPDVEYYSTVMTDKLKAVAKLRPANASDGTAVFQDAKPKQERQLTAEYCLGLLFSISLHASVLDLKAPARIKMWHERPAGWPQAAPAPLQLPQRCLDWVQGLRLQAANGGGPLPLPAAAAPMQQPGRSAGPLPQSTAAAATLHIQSAAAAAAVAAAAAAAPLQQVQPRIRSVTPPEAAAGAVAAVHEQHSPAACLNVQREPWPDQLDVAATPAAAAAAGAGAGAEAGAHAPQQRTPAARLNVQREPCPDQLDTAVAPAIPTTAADTPDAAAAADGIVTITRCMWQIDGDWLQKMVSPSDAKNNSLVFGGKIMNKLCGGELPTVGNEIRLRDVDSGRSICTTISKFTKQQNWLLKGRELKQWKADKCLATGDQICVRSRRLEEHELADGIHFALDLKRIPQDAASTAPAAADAAGPRGIDSAAVGSPDTDGAAVTAATPTAVAAGDVVAATTARAVGTGAAAVRDTQNPWQDVGDGWWAKILTESAARDHKLNISPEAAEGLFGSVVEQSQDVLLWDEALQQDRPGPDPAILRRYTSRGVTYRMNGSGIKQWIIDSRLVAGDAVHLKRADPTAMPDGSSLTTLYIKRVPRQAQDVGGGRGSGGTNSAAAGSTERKPTLSAAAASSKRGADSTASGLQSKRPRPV
ncbi:hypothetical protein D9Q98_010138 [Chlorella vulgaris]|uniref:Uncharacterized protein n=1 Tax=Chlorella vulgaris TaxID=3077 RepID=A0A9D4TNK8_CHLVU|nr:hypothetical protein D9Q98_010138 [Chlorella vulgaris]